MDLVRLGLERGANAQEALEVMVRLLEEHGQGGGCGHEQRSFTYHSSFLIADPGNAWVLETAGHHWAENRVDGVRSISNGLTIQGFADRHTDRIKTWASRCRTRQALTSKAARAAHGAGDLMAILRDHGDGRTSPRYDWITGGISAPCVYPGGLVVNSQTTGSWVSELGPEGARHWATATAAPCTSLFKPVEVTEPLLLGPTPTDVADPDSLWWRHERLHRAVMRNPDRLTPLFTDERDEVERRWLTDPPSPGEAFAEGDRLLDGWTAAVCAEQVRDTRPLRLRRYWQVRNRRANFDQSNNL